LQKVKKTLMIFRRRPDKKKKSDELALMHQRNYDVLFDWVDQSIPNNKPNRNV